MKKLILIISALVFLSPLSAFAAIARVGFSGHNATTWTDTVSGSNTLLVVGCLSAGVPLTGITDNLTSLTYDASASGVASANWSLDTYYLLSPPSGSNAIVVTPGSAYTPQCYSTIYSGVNQSGQPDAHSFNSCSSCGSLANSVTTVAENTVVTGVCGNASGTGNFSSLAGGFTTVDRSNGIALGDNVASPQTGGTTVGGNCNQGGGGNDKTAFGLISFSPAASVAPLVSSILGLVRSIFFY